MAGKASKAAGDAALTTFQSQNSNNPLVEFYQNFSDETFFRSPTVPQSYDAPYNSDDLWRKTGSYSVYEKMVQDDQVSVCLQLKKNLVLGGGGDFVPGDDGQDEIVDDLRCAFFEDYEGTWSNDLEEIISAYEFGLSITEKTFKYREGGLIGPRCLKTRHPNSWRLYQDDRGVITKYEQITDKGDIEISKNCLIHFINNPKFQNPYGTSDLRAAHAAWFTKTQITKFFAIFLEKAASATPVGRYDKSAPQNVADKLFNILKSFQAKTAIVIPKDVEVDFLESKNNGEAYVKAIHLFNMFIGRALFIPDLVGFTGGETGGGSLALGKEQLNLFFMHIYRRREQLENIINKELVQPIIQYNWGYVKNPPKFKFKPLDDMRALEFAKTWLEAVKGKAYVPNEEEINHFRRLVQFPEGDVVLPSAQPNPALNQGDGNENLQGQPAETAGDAGQEAIEDKDQGSAKEEMDEKESEKSDKKMFKKAFDPTPGSYSKKVNFKAIETKLNDYDQSVLNDCKPIVKRMFTDLYDQIEKKRIIETKNTDRIETIELRYKKDLKQVLKNSFVQLYKDAKSQAATELNKSEYKKPLVADEFLKVIESETYSFVGKYEYMITERVRLALIAAIKDGLPLSSVFDQLDEDLGGLSDVALERFARTKHTEVMNNARVDYFTESEVVAAYQYSAILDDKTSDICSGLHGKIFTAGTEPIPPMHFNCRSMLIPITKYEEFKPTETIRGMPVDEFIDENKGKGFSTK